MNNKFLFSIGLIIVAIIGFGCVSAADAHNSTMSENPSITVEQQQNLDMIQNQNEIINTEKAVKEDIEPSQIKEIRTNNIKIVQVSNDNSTKVDDTKYTNSTPKTVNINDILEPVKSEAQINKSTTSNIQAGNGFTEEEVIKIKEYTQFYKEHNYDLRLLIKQIGSDYNLAGNMNSTEQLWSLGRFISAIHNEAVASRGYGKFFTTEDAIKKMLFIGLDNFFRGF